MESKVIFRDYQEQQAQDHNDLQSFTERSFDHLVLDAVTAERRYAGFTTVKTGQVEIQIQPGRMYDVLGVIYALNTTTVQSMVTYLAAAYQRWVLLSVVGAEVETDIEERDYLIDVTTGATEPRAVATTRSRAAVLAFTQGVESADPQRPSIPISHCPVAWILVDTTQVVSITMEPDYRVTSTDNLDLRSDDLEAFAALIGPKVAALAADLADLRNRLNQMATSQLLLAVTQDVARLKASLKYNVVGAVDYHTDWFLDSLYTDATDSFSLGNDNMVMEGLRFGYANMDEFELSLFSANDPAAAYSNGVLLPKYVEIFRLGTAAVSNTVDSYLGMAQYGFQTVEMKQGYMSRSRIRYGDNFWRCTNNMIWGQGDMWGSNQYMTQDQYNPISQLYDANSGMTSTRMQTMGAQYYGYLGGVEIAEYTRYDNWWFDEWKEPFMYAVTVDHVLNGAFIAQSFLVANDIWATSIWVYIGAKGGNADIQVAVTEMIAGVPDPRRTMVKVAYPEASIVVGWNKVAIPPTFMKKGAKYALCLISSANHSVGMIQGQKYLDGTFFYSTDGIYYLGDLTKDLMFMVYGAYFNSPQSWIEFGAINLDGGFRNIDILAAMWVPSSVNIYWEVQPGGTGEWQPLTIDNSGVLSVAPVLARFRAKFDGSRDMQGAITLTGSRVRVWRPKTTFKHVSKNLTLATGCTTVKVTCRLEHYDETPHDHTCTLMTGAAHAVPEAPDVTATKLLDAVGKHYERVYTFNVSPAITQFLVLQTGTTNSSQNTFHVAERTMLATA